MRPATRLPLALSISGFTLWLLFGAFSTWWTGILALAAPLLALRCLPLSKAIPLALGNVLLGGLVAHAVRTRSLDALPLEAAAKAAVVVALIGLVGRVVTTWRPLSGWLFLPAALVVVDRVLDIDLYGRFGDGTVLSPWARDLGAPAALLVAGLLLEALLGIASVGNRQIADPVSQSVRESGIRRAGVVGVVLVLVVALGGLVRDLHRGAVPQNDVAVVACGALIAGLLLAGLFSWRASSEKPV